MPLEIDMEVILVGQGSMAHNWKISYHLQPRGEDKKCK
jgi:hypothetical protein